MGTSRLSTYGLELANLRILSNGQSTLSTLSTQLATKKRSLSLSDYTTSEAQRVLNLSSEVTQENTYLSTINTISSRVNSYDTVLTSMEKVTSTISSTLTSSQSYNPSTNGTLVEEVSSSLNSIMSYLNSSLNGVYIFSGARYDTAPVNIDWQSLPSPPTDVVVDDTALPTYDTDYPGTATQISNAWTRNSIMIDSTQSLSYGVTSTEKGFQELVLGLRWAYAATQDSANYSTYMGTARNLITQAVSDIRSTHTRVSNSGANLSTTKNALETNISNLQSSIDDIQSVDTNEVGVKITTYQSVLEASYSAVAILAKLSLVSYL